METSMVKYRAAVDDGRRFLEGIMTNENIVLLFHADADGSCAGTIVYKTLQYLGDDMVFVVFMEKSETLYSDTLRHRVLARRPSKLIVMDTGSRAREIIPGISTMVIDHHRPDSMPPVDTFVSSYGVDPPAPTSLVTYQICRELAPSEGLSWLAAVGTGADLGIDAGLEVLQDARSRYGDQSMKETISPINAARRAPAHDMAMAFSALIHADDPRDISGGVVPEYAALKRYRDEVNAELRRTVRTRPVIGDPWAVVQFHSPALVHPLIAAVWTRRLKDHIVIAANYGYTEGNVHFSVRSAKPIDLIEALRGVRPASPTEEYAHGHPTATGGILPLPEFQRLLRDLGFPPATANAAI